MKAKIALCITLFSLFTLQAQVGIGTTNPNASLDVRSSNQATPTNTDGILIPKADNFPATNPTATQDGMLLYITGNGIPTKGFYYWDNSASNWTSVTGVQRIDDLIDGRSDSSGTSIFLGVNAGSNDDLLNNRNVGVGHQALQTNTSGDSNVAMGYNSLYSTTTGSNNTAIGFGALLSNTTGFNNTAIGSTALLGNTGGYNNTAIGIGSLYGNNGYNNVALGGSAGLYETGSHKLYIENSGANPDNALIYGDFGLDDTTTGNILRTNSQFQIGNPTLSGYAFPTTDGMANQVLQTDGNGALSWVNENSGTDNQNLTGATLTGTSLQIDIENGTSTSIDLAGLQDGVGAQRINDLIDGKSDNDGTDDGSSIFLGIDAGANDSEAHNRNIGIGYQSMQTNVSSTRNVAVGYQSLSSNVGGSRNTANGCESLVYNTLGDDNVANGYRSLFSNTTGENNVATGGYSLSLNTIGNNNIANGFQALFSNTTGNNNIAVGYQAGYFETGSSKLYIENSNADADNALIYGEFNTNILRTNSTFQIGNPTLTGYAFPTVDGTANQVLQTDGNGVLSWVNSSSFADNLGNHTATTDVNLSTNNVIGVNYVSTRPVSSYDKLRVWNTGNFTIGLHSAMTYGFLNDYAMSFTMNEDTDRGWIWRDSNDAQNDGAMSLTTDGRLTLKSDLRVDTNTLSVNATTNRVGIGVVTPAYQLQLSTNSAAKPTSGLWTVASDQRLKTNVKPFTDGMNIVSKINPIWFSYNGKAGISTSEKGVGTIAQELQKIAPYMVTDWKYENASGESTSYLGVNYGALDFVLVNALKEQQETITKQQQEIDQLKQEIQLIKDMLVENKK